MKPTHSHFSPVQRLLHWTMAFAILTMLFVGIATPSRDMLVRAATPPGAFGRVFGFVSSGFNIGSMMAPTREPDIGLHNRSNAYLEVPVNQRAALNQPASSQPATRRWE